MRPGLALLALCLACGSHTSPLSQPPVNPDAIRRACAMEVSCFTSPPITPAGSCVSQYELGLATGYLFLGPYTADYQRYVDCANSNSDCTSALDCASQNHGPDWCNAHATVACDGDLLVGCVSGWGLYLTDCKSLGMHCGTANGYASCTDGSTCDPATSAARCDGSHFIDCNSATDLESNVDCASFIAGGTCRRRGMSSFGSIGCFPPSSSSCAMDGATCDGKAAVVCVAGTQLRVECGQFASHCVVDNMGKFDCVPDASDCTSSSADSCVGNALQICVNGTWTQTACSSFGLSTCSMANGASQCQ